MDEVGQLINELSCGITNTNNKIDSIGNYNIINNSPVEEIENDIRGLNRVIKKINRSNHKTRRIRNIKIFGEFGKMALPYVVVAGLLFGIQTLTFDVPFVKQNQVKIAQNVYTQDSLYNHSSETTYVVRSKADNSDYVTYMSKWEKKADGKYYRTIDEYKFRWNDNTLQVLLNLLDSNVTNKLKGVYEDPVSTRYETKLEGELTEEELAQGDYVKLVDHSFDEKDVIIASQDDVDNIIYSIIYVLALAASGVGVYFVRKNTSNYNFLRLVSYIKSAYPEKDINYYIKLYEELKAKFAKVKNEQVSLVDPITGTRSIVRG